MRIFPSLLSLGLSFVCLASVSAESIIVNGSMTEGTGTPASWKAQGAKLVRDTEVFKSAPSSMRLEFAGAGGVQQALHGVTSGEVSVHGVARVEGGLTFVQVALQVFDSQGKQIDWKVVTNLKPSKDWLEFSGKVTLDGKGAAVMLNVISKGNGTVWMDDIAVEAEARPKAESTTASLPEAVALPVAIEPGNAALRFVGRWDTSDPAGPRCAWPGSAVTTHFTGTALNAKIRGNRNDRWVAIVDGKPGEAFSLQAESGLYTLARDLSAGEHVVTVSKITEAQFGNDQVLGFQLNAGAKLLPVTPPPHRIEVIGDSISAGYGVEGGNEKEHFSPTTENNSITYGAITARKFDADFVCIAWSGKKMWPPELYDRALPQDPKSAWDFSRWKPEVVLINLCTNDFGQGNPEEDGWVKAYADFLERVRKNYPACTIYCAVGPMISDPYSKSKNALSTATRYIQSAIAQRDSTGDKKIHFLNFATQGAHGFGSDWHPNAKQNQIMADSFVKAIEENLGWKPLESDDSGWRK